MRESKKILIVCGGNTCRSPMAEVILTQMLKSKGFDKQFKVNSAGYRGADGISAHTNAKQVMKELYGADLLASHTPKKLTEAMVDEADLIIVMEDDMKANLPANKIIVLGISDPYGPDIQKYRTCATEIQKSFQKNWLKIVGHATPSKNTTPQHPSPPQKSIVRNSRRIWVSW